VRTNEAGVDASRVASLPAVRDGLFELQRSFREAPGLVADGRDMGTVVFPEADVKIYLTASAEARAERRYNQLKHKDIDVSLHALFQSIQARDERDMNREVSPLKPAEDAFVIDSTDLDIEEVLKSVEAIVTEKLG
jgi:cytidylate kinase